MEKKTKASKTQKPVNCGYTVLATVPYQKCPVCDGSGIIPMHIINEKLLQISSKNYGEDGVCLSSEEISKLL